MKMRYWTWWIFFFLFSLIGHAEPKNPDITTELVEENTEEIQLPNSKANCDEALQFLPLSYYENYSKKLLSKIQKELTADQINAFGMRCHRMDRFEESAHFFALAIVLEPKHVLAHYNLACAFTRLLEKGYPPCERLKPDIERISYLLYTSSFLSPERKQRMRVDRDLDFLRNQIWFRRMYLGESIQPVNTADIFSGVWLWGPSMGAFIYAKVFFKRDTTKSLTGTVQGWGLDYAQEKFNVKGTWVAEEGQIIIQWEHTENIKKGNIAGCFTSNPEIIKLERLDHYPNGTWFTRGPSCRT
jgi:hypothetical protein